MKTNILGVNIDVVTPKEALGLALSFLTDGGKHTIFTPNPEFIMTARRDREIADILNNSDLNVPDGIGIFYASKLNKIKIKRRVPGYDLVQDIFGAISATGESVYFFGGKPGVAELARDNTIKKYPGLRVAGTSSGFFDKDGERTIINDIKASSPDMLLVGIGFPKQEKWIVKNMGSLPAKLYIGVGGSLDGIAGVVPRAPRVFRRLGLEWLYRLARQPSRIKRQRALPIFAAAVVADKISGLFKRKK